MPKDNINTLTKSIGFGTNPYYPESNDKLHNKVFKEENEEIIQAESQSSADSETLKMVIEYR